MKCLREGHGDVGFFHSYDIVKHYDQFSEEFDIVCKKERQPLTWENIAKVGCHLTVEHPQVRDGITQDVGIIKHQFELVTQ